MKQQISFIKKHSTSLFLVVFLGVFIYTGKFALLQERAENFLGTTEPVLVNDMQFNYLGNNQAVKLTELKGKVVLVNFWATWCPPCKVEIPGFIDLYSQYKPKGFELIGVSVDTTGIDSVMAFAKEENINYPVAMATPDIVGKFEEMVAVPTSFLIDQNGQVVKKYSGLYPKSTFENDIKALLENS